MHFASPLPLWFAALVAAGVGAAAWFSYRTPRTPLTRAQRTGLIMLRGCTLGLLLLLLSRPTVLEPPGSDRAAVVPILIDVSRSMRIEDADGQARIARARQLAATVFLPNLARRYTPELYGFGDSVMTTALDSLKPDAPRTDLSGAVAAIRERYRGKRIAGIVVISDGGDTGRREAPDDNPGPPVFAVGVGSADGVRDREVIGVTADDPRLDQSSVDLHVSAVSHGFGREAFDVRLLAGGRPVETRRVTPSADGSPVETVFTVSPDPANPTLYSAEIGAASGEAIVENNSRSVLVSPAGPPRRILMIEGAPGFDHSFLARALARDRVLEVDSVVRKGRSENGQDTFLVQAAEGRAASLTAGLPDRRESLYAYDALFIANIESDFFTKAQLSMLGDFVSERGGGLLVMGARSFDEHGLIGTPLEDALPVELNDRRAGLVRNAGGEAVAPHNQLVLTADGENHPVMRMGASPEQTRQVWSALPALAGSAALGGPKPGATVLAVTATAGNAVYPVVAVQRFGRGRSMIFAGEAAWRWRMMRPSTDHTYEYFWRQAARWLAGSAPTPVSVSVSDSPEPGDSIEIDVDARDASYAPVSDADVSVTLSRSDGESRAVGVRHQAGSDGRFAGVTRADAAGMYRVHVEARRRGSSLGSSDRWFYVGGANREFTEPRLNEGALRRLALESGGAYEPAANAGRLLPILDARAPAAAAPVRRDLWHSPSVFVLAVALLSAEWILRRRWGLR